MRHALIFFGIPTAVMIATHLTIINESAENFNILTTPILFAGLILIGIGYFYRKSEKNFIKAGGWFLFAIYWATQPEFLYYKGDRDIVNAVFCILGVYFISYMSYHEYLSYKRGENIKSMDFLAGATFFSGIIYFLFQKIDFMAGLLIKVVAVHSAGILRAFGYNAEVGGIYYGLNTHVPIYFNGHESVQLILACTGLQSIAVFAGVLLALKADKNRRIKAFLYTVPTIYILNLIRNAGVVYGMEEMGLSFYMMHNVIGKIGSLIALIILAFIVFELLPELYENIMDLFNLPKRNGPIERMFKRII
ncbi:MAG TPA: archaeosortase A [Thermoplasmatales archaeon]|nr:archaeosortase A [Thermoplasmatales archaeon]